MSSTTLDPEDALDMLGVEEDASSKSDEGLPAVEFPPINPVRPGLQPSAAASAMSGSTGDSDAKARLVAAQKAREKAEQDRDRLDKLVKDAQARIKKLEEDLGAARKGGGDEKLAQVTRERDHLRQEVEQLRAGGGRGRMPGLPSDDDEGPLPKEGLLEQIPYARVLVRLLKERFTGRLSLRAGKTLREVFFEEGAPVAYSSSEPGERLGRVLVAQGRITEEQYLAAARSMVETGAKLTDALLEMGAITNERLQQEQRQLTRDQIISGFALTQGSFTFEAGKGPHDEVAKFEFRMGEIYLQGYRRHAAEAEVQAVYAALKDTYVRARAEMTSFKPQLGLDPDDERILKMLGEAYTVEEAVDRSGVAQEKGVRLVGALKMLGLISEWKPGVPEFEARLKAEKLRQSEEILALKQKLREREEQVLADVQKSLQRIESLMQGGLPPAASASAAAAPPPAPTPNPNLTPPSSPAPAAPRAKTGSTPPVSAPPTEDALAAVNALGDTSANDAKAEEGPGMEKYKEGMRQAAGGRLDEAETALREAVRLDAAKPSYLTALARVLLANPRYERSGTLPVVRSLLDRALSLSPGDAEVNALLQRIQQEMT